MGAWTMVGVRGVMGRGEGAGGGGEGASMAAGGGGKGAEEGARWWECERRERIVVVSVMRLRRGCRRLENDTSSSHFGRAGEG